MPHQAGRLAGVLLRVVLSPAEVAARHAWEQFGLSAVAVQFSPRPPRSTPPELPPLDGDTAGDSVLPGHPQARAHAAPQASNKGPSVQPGVAALVPCVKHLPLLPSLLHHMHLPLVSRS